MTVSVDEILAWMGCMLDGPVRVRAGCGGLVPKMAGSLSVVAGGFSNGESGGACVTCSIVQSSFSLSVHDGLSMHRMTHLVFSGSMLPGFSRRLWDANWHQ